jgi:hypothetical protein
VIKNKAKFYAEQRAGRCGNYYPQWLSYEELLASGYTGLVNIRDLKSGRRQQTKERYRVPVSKVPKALRCNGAGVGFFPTPRDECLTIQGEYSENGGWAELRYTHVKLPMLRAFDQQSLRTTGAAARYLLRKYMDGPSLETLDELVSQHTDFCKVNTPTVEFTCYSVSVGIENRNTVFWEVRNY